MSVAHTETASFFREHDRGAGGGPLRVTLVQSSLRVSVSYRRHRSLFALVVFGNSIVLTTVNCIVVARVALIIGGKSRFIPQNLIVGYFCREI